MESQTPNRRLGDLGLLSRLRKLRDFFADSRGNANMASEAKKKFDNLCAKNKINPKTLRLDGYSYGNKNVLELKTNSRHLDANLRACCLLIGEFFNCNIRASRRCGLVRLDFVSVDPVMPDDALEAFEYMWGVVEREWKTEVDRYQARGSKTGTIFDRMFFSKPSKKSFVSGFYHEMRVRLTAEKAARDRLKKIQQRSFFALAAPKRANGPENEQEPKTPWIPPPPNAMALMCLPKRRASNPIAEEMEAPTESPPDAEETDPEFNAEEAVVADSILKGRRVAALMDLNQMKL